MFIYRLPFVALAMLSAYWLAAQSPRPIANLVEQARQNDAVFREARLFQIITEHPDPIALRAAPNAQFLTLDLVTLESIAEERPGALTLEIPWHGDRLLLDLVRVNLSTPDFTVVTNLDEDTPAAYENGVHYQGILRNDAHSLVAISIFRDEIMGLVADTRHGNRVLGRLDLPGNFHNYILYEDRDLKGKNPFSCTVVEHNEKPVKIGAPSGPDAVNGCVRAFLEVDYELFQNKGSIAATVNYLTGVFNQVAALYTNEQIKVSISQVLVWVTPDAYSNSSSSTVLNQFRSFRTGYNGDIAHLVGIGGNNLGGIAFLDVLCVPSYAYGYSDINPTYSNVPTFSWTVEVMTHEMGHNLGSPHTQSCTWPGGAIDNCVPTEGACSSGPAPSNGGTIMSYCHLTAYGINFNNGFGPLPGNIIRTEVGAATCLPASCSPQGNCAAPVDLSLGNISGSGAVVSWASTSGATAYTLRYRPVGAASWTTVNNAVSPYTLSGLPANDEIEVSVRADCGSLNSDFKNGLIFVTGASGGGGGATCSAPANLSASTTATTALATWSSVSGATAYQLSYKIATSSTWSNPTSVSGASFNISGLTAATTYNVRVAAICGATTSAFITTNFTTQTSGGGGGGGATCGTPAGLSGSTTSSTITAVWNGVAGANSYQISFKLSTSTVWSNPLSTTGASYTLSGLAAASTYNVRVRTVCSSTTSAYASATFTTLSNGGGANCPTPNTPGASSVTSNSANVNWPAIPGAQSYNLQIKRSANTNWLTFSGLPSSSVLIQGLATGTSYDIRVRANCSGGMTSAYSNVLTFTTASFLAAAKTDKLVGDAKERTLEYVEATDVMTLTPNPASQRVSVFLEFDEETAVQVSLLDLYGRLLHTESTQLQSGAVELDLSDLPSGVYFVQANANNRKRMVKRLVKQ